MWRRPFPGAPTHRCAASRCAIFSVDLGLGFHATWRPRCCGGPSDAIGRHHGRLDGYHTPRSSAALATWSSHGRLGTQRIYGAEQDFEHPVVLTAEGSIQSAPGPHDQQIRLVFGWRLHVSCLRGYCVARWAVASARIRQVVSQPNCVALCLLHRAALRGPNLGELRLLAPCTVLSGRTTPSSTLRWSGTRRVRGYSVAVAFFSPWLGHGPAAAASLGRGPAAADLFGRGGTHSPLPPQSPCPPSPRAHLLQRVNCPGPPSSTSGLDRPTGVARPGTAPGDRCIHLPGARAARGWRRGEEGSAETREGRRRHPFQLPLQLSDSGSAPALSRSIIM